MPRNRLRRTEKAKWTAEDLQKAVNAVNDGQSVKSVSKMCNIPRTTLRDRLKDNRPKLEKPALGRKPLFSEEQEKEIRDHLLLLSNMFYGFSFVELRRLAFALAEANGIAHNFNRTTKLAGPDWVYGFLNRNPEVSLRKPEATSLNRISAFNESEVQLFFTNLESVMVKFAFPASRIYNIDETGISTVHKPGKIFGPKGQKQVGAATSWERGKNVTVVCAMSAAGNFIPPMFVYPRQRMTPLLQKGGPRDAIYCCSKNGWSNEELFLEWLKHFSKHTKPTSEDPILLILDNHSSHKNYDVYNFCRENGIHIVSLPPHTSHRLQPLDVSFYGPLKTAFNRECGLFLKAHSNTQTKITQYDLAEIFNRAYIRTATLEKGVSGFQSAGIYPLNPNKFNRDDFLEPQEIEVPVVIDEDIVDGLHHAADVQPSTTSDAKKREMPSQSAVPHPPSAPKAKQDTIQSISNSSTATGNTLKVTVQDLSPVPSHSKSTHQGKRYSKKQHSEILTSTPMKAVFEEAKKKKESKRPPVQGKRPARTTRKSKKTCRRNITFESSDENDEDERNLCDDDDNDDIDPIGIGDDVNVCIICDEYGKNNELWYRCTQCSKWAHAECSGQNSPENYVCDFCLCN